MTALGAGVHELASVLEVVGVPGLQGRQEHQLQRDSVGEALLEVPACAVAVDFVAMRDAGGCDAGAGCSPATKRLRSAKPR